MSQVRAYLGATIPAIVVLSFFVSFANWIPQTRWAPPVRQTIAAESSPEELAVVGEKIVRERGCLACHTIEPGAGEHGQGRGPNFAGIGARRASGVAGGPATSVEYLAQALYEPGAHLVEGYANIMPAATRPPAKLEYGEIVAVIDYLQSLGATPSARLGEVPQPPAAGGSTAAPAPAGASGSPTAATAPAAKPDGAALFVQHTCQACHSMQAGETLIGPSLAPADLAQAAKAAGTSTQTYLLDSIVDPRAVERDPFPKQVMPDTYGTQLTAAEVRALIAFILGTGGG